MKRLYWLSLLAVCLFVGQAYAQIDVVDVQNSGTSAKLWGGGKVTVNFVNGGCASNSSTGAVDCTLGGDASDISATTATNPSAETQLKQLSLPAGALNVANRHVKVYFSGRYTTASAQTPTLRFRLYLCTVSGCGSGTVLTLADFTTAATTGAITNSWKLEGNIGTASTGATGTLETKFWQQVQLGIASDLTPETRLDQTNAASSAIDLTAALYLRLTVLASSSNAGNSVVARMAYATMGNVGSGWSGSISGASSASKYILQTADANLPNAQVLGSLTTGLVKNTTTTGVLSIAASGTDYAPATSGTSILKGNGSGGFSAAAAGTDYAAATSGTSILKGNGAGGFSNATAGTDYAAATSGSAPLKGNGAGGTAAALAADIVALFSACSGTQYLGADGACHNAGAGGGITNSAPSGDLGQSDGTNIVASGVKGDGTGNVTLPAGKSIGSSDTGTPKITFGTNLITLNQPLSVPSITTTGTPAASTITCVAAPSTPGAGQGAYYCDTTSKALAIKNDAGVVSHTVQSKTAVANNFVTQIADDGTVSVAQPAFSGLSGTATAAQITPTYMTVGSGAIGNLSSANGMAQFVICTGTCDVKPITPPAANYQLCVIMRAGATGTITLNALGNSALYPKTDSSAYGTAGTGTMAASSAQGNMVCIVGSDSTHYELGSYRGTWTVN